MVRVRIPKVHIRMTTHLLLVATAATAALVIAAPARAATRSCGTVNDHAMNIKASGVSCKAAKRVARKYTVYSGEQDKTPFGYTCNRRTRPDMSWTETCRKTGKRITWRGVPVG